MKGLLLSVFIVVASSASLMAQPNPPPQPNIVPITGLEYLLLGGGAYGAYRLHKKKKNQKA